MMDEFAVLLEEHDAMRACAAQLLVAATHHDDLAQVGRLLHPLVWMASKVHSGKEDAALLKRMPSHHLATPAMVQLLKDRAGVEQRLTLLADQWHSAPELFCLEEVLLSLMQLLAAEERMVYASIYDQSTDDDLWQICVELDRKVDIDGRAARARFLELYPLQISAQRSTERASG